jgi:release factor glutamine methyltransferase
VTPERRATQGLSAGQALRACALPEAEKRALLARAIGVRREFLVAHPETPVGTAALERFTRMTGERQAGTPLAYLLGEREFYGHSLRVTPDVLIPRPDTEVLVERALEALHGRGDASVLDLGTGSGCIAVALAAANPGWFVVAIDRSIAALRVARLNCRRLGVRVHLVAADWYAPIRGRFDLIVSNPPYIAAADAHLAQLVAEPRAALTDEGDGLGAMRAIVAEARDHLAPGGRLLVEHGFDQAAATRELMLGQGLCGVRTYLDLEGRERVCDGARAPSPGSR